MNRTPLGERLIIAGGLLVAFTAAFSDELADRYFTAGVVVGVAMILIGVVWS